MELNAQQYSNASPNNSSRCNYSCSEKKFRVRKKKKKKIDDSYQI
uniref:Uncharacterized protein n=1 Tax=Nelumbo nucifera TaxID=4432 RepID=A0A822ZHK9_NELNU|nr:TPA_asm: hypothetical protein HUJ06_001155 [Nelumbo nucifera]